MQTFVLILHMVLALVLVGLVLLQKSEGGALGMGGSSSMGGLMSTRGTANLLTRLTAIFATLFFGTTLVLALMFKNATQKEGLFDKPIESSRPGAPEVPQVPKGS